MIDGLKPYPKMKDSGVPWLGEVPEHWELRRTKTLLRERVEKGHPDQPLLAATQSKGVVRKEQYENRTVLALKDLHLLKLVRVGDFVISLRSFQGGIEYAREQGIISPAYTILYPTRADMHGYLARLFKSAPYIENLSLYVTGIRQGQNIDYEKLARTELPLPPLPEQVAIVRFLDYVDRRIRRYIRAKQKLIKLLEEQKQAIIHRAVTRGLDPNVRLKPSGVEWLGDVPEHWEVRRVLSCLEGTRAGIWGDDPTPANEADHVTCLRVADFDMSRLSIHGSKLTKRAVPASLRNPRLLAAGDILMEKSGGGETEPVGRVVLYDENVAPHAICSNFIVRLRPNATTEPKFLLHVLAIMQVTRRNVPCIKQTTGIQNLDERAYLSLAIGVPPLVEQQAIIASLTNRLRPIDKAASRARREIDLLREYRTRLIADVVTGKLDVREAAARLPDEIEEPEPLDETEAEGDADDAGVGDADEMIEEAET